MSDPVFEHWAQRYRDAGYEPRPVKPGTKACKIKEWAKPDAEFGVAELGGWASKYPKYGIGLRLGTEFADGTKLAVLDIDDDRYIRPAKFLLGNPPCGRIGSKGIAYFVRLTETLKTRKLWVKSEQGDKFSIGELLGDGAFCVIPPTIHPDTNAAYRWVGTPLLDTDFNSLTIIEV